MFTLLQQKYLVILHTQANKPPFLHTQYTLEHKAFSMCSEKAIILLFILFVMKEFLITLKLV